MNMVDASSVAEAGPQQTRQSDLGDSTSGQGFGWRGARDVSGRARSLLRIFSFGILYCLVSVCGFAGGSAHAESDESDQTPAAAQSSRAELAPVLTELVVTAEKREERLLEVPVPVSVVDASQLTAANQVRLQDWYSQVPSLAFDEGVQSNQGFSIRGLGAIVMLDDVPIYGGVIPDIDPGNLSRIEVLRGPQGTLYGGGELGGVVNMVTLDPSTKALSAQVQSGVDTVKNGYDLGYTMRGAVNIPVSETFAFRLSGFSRQDAGYIDNPLLDIQGINRDSAHGGLITGFWKPSDSFSAKLDVLYQEIRGGLNDVDFYDSLTNRPLGDLQQGYVNGIGPYDRRLTGDILVLKGDIANFDISSITGYLVNHVTDYTETTPIFGTGAATVFPQVAVSIGGTPTAGVPLYTDQYETVLTQELRLKRTFAEKLDVFIGGYYARIRAPTRLTVLADNPVTGALGGVFGTFYLPTPQTETAGFADLTYRFTDQFDVQIGGRYSHIANTFQTIVGGPYVTVYGVTNPVGPETHASSNPVTYLFTPRYRFTADTMIYMRLASAFQPGGANAPGPGVPPEYGPVKTENYEVGFKGSFLDHALTIDTSIYRIKEVDISSPFYNSTTQETYNVAAGNARSQGLECTVQARPTGSLTLTSWIVFSDAYLTGFPQDQTAAAGGETVGDPLTNSSRFSFNASAHQEFPLWGATGFLEATTGYIGERFGPFAQPRQVYPAYAKTDFRVGATYGSWAGSLYVNNVADRRGEISGDTQSLIPYSRYIIKPRAVGLLVEWKY